MTISLDDFAALIELAGTLHFGQAAERLHVSQPALSKRIKKMEAEIGGPLALRDHRDVRLTEAGRLVAGRGRRLVAALGPRSPWLPRAGLRSVAAEPFIIIARSRSASFYDHALSVCAAAGFAPRIVQEASELYTVLSLVRAGLGVSLVPRSAALMRLRGVRFRELTTAKAAWNIAVAWRRDSNAAPLVKRFVEMVPGGIDRRPR